jgi:hypothetical protein
MEQNFVPVTDDRGAFIGIVRRRAILEFCTRMLAEGFFTDADAAGSSRRSHD